MDRRSKAATFVNIIKIVTVFIKRILIQSKKVKRMKSYVSKCNLYLYFLDIGKFSDFRLKNADFSRAQRGCHVIQIFFGCSLGKV